MRVPEFHESFGDTRTIIGVEGQRGVNAFSIAEATGIPRETVRRKLKELVARGVLMEKERGRYVMAPGFLQKPENDAALQQVLGHFAAAHERRRESWHREDGQELALPITVSDRTTASCRRCRAPAPRACRHGWRRLTTPSRSMRSTMRAARL